MKGTESTYVLDIYLRSLLLSHWSISGSLIYSAPEWEIQTWQLPSFRQSQGTWAIARVGNMLQPSVLSPGWWMHILGFRVALSDGTGGAEWERAWRKVNLSKSHQGLVAIPIPLTGFERSGDNALTCASPHAAPVSRGTLQPLSAPRWDWKHLSARLHKLSFLPTCMYRRHIRAKRHREVNSMSQHGWEMEPVKSLPQRSLAPTHAQKMLAQLWVFTVPMKSTSHALQVASAAFGSQRDHPSCRQVLYKIPK